MISDTRSLQMVSMPTWSPTKNIQLNGRKLHFWKRNWKGRKIKEALFINAQNPGKEINRGKLLNLEKGITLDPIWGTFNPELRKIATKKIMRRTWFLRCLLAFPFFSIRTCACMRVYLHVLYFGWVNQWWNLIEGCVNQDPDEDTNECRNVGENYLWQN